MNTSVLQCLWNAHPQYLDTTQRVLVGFLLLIITIISFILNFTLGCLCHRKKSTFDGIFRWHVISLVTAALSYLLTNCSILIPTALFGLRIDDPLNTILTVFDVFGFLALSFTTTTIAVDRFILFWFQNIHVPTAAKRLRLFSWFPAIPWLTSIFLTVHMNIVGCYARTDPFTLTYTYDCSECGFYRPFMYYLNFSLPGITIILYCAIYAKILFLRKPFRDVVRSSERKKAVNLVMQCSLISAIQFASSACFYVIPAVINGGNTAQYLTMIISTLNSMANPCVMFAFQPRLRKALRKRPSASTKLPEITVKVQFQAGNQNISSGEKKKF